MADHDDLFLKFDFHALAHSRDKQISDAVNLLGDDYVLNVNEEVRATREGYTCSAQMGTARSGQIGTGYSAQ